MEGLLDEKGGGGFGTGFPLGQEGQLLPLNEIVLRYIAFALERNSGAKDRTARALGIDRKTLYKKARELNPPSA